VIAETNRLASVPFAAEPADVGVTLARALEAAAAAGKWDVVSQLAREIEARRLDAAGVPKLDAERRKREK
jgi:hypothetical protein